MIKLWGRTNSMNVQKVLWVLDDLGLAYERIDAGMQYGVNNTAEYLRMNPNGKIPLIKDGDLAVWESHAICRYLCNKAGSQKLYPQDPQARAPIDQWIDWALSTLIGPLSTVFWILVRTPAEKRDPAKLKEESSKLLGALEILNTGLTNRSFIASDHFSLADLILAAPVYRCIKLDSFDHQSEHFAPLMAWYAKVRTQPGFKRWVEIELT